MFQNVILGNFITLKYVTLLIIFLSYFCCDYYLLHARSVSNSGNKAMTEYYSR
jgi:hypothetical protein